MLGPYAAVPASESRGAAVARSPGVAPLPAVPVPLHEATVAGLHAALELGVISCEQLIRAVLARIEAYDRQGPTLRALITVSPWAMDEAVECDRRRAEGGPLPSLYGMPLVLKDNFDTADLATSSGSVTLRDLRPVEDAFVVARLRAAGAIVVGKANMTELAYGGTSVSGLGGQVVNPYDLTRTPGGSSGGTGAALAASYAVLGTGSDTGQSIRSPASACALVGIRPTQGLVSRHGVMPFSPTQDAVGPLARTVTDAALMLDVMAGTDPRDAATADADGHKPASYTDALGAGHLRGVRLGLLTAFLGRETVHGPVNGVVRSAVGHFTRLGAVVVPVGIPGLEELTAGLSLMHLEVAAAVGDYLKGHASAPVRSLRALLARGEVHPSLRAGLEADARVRKGPGSAAHRVLLARRDELRQAVLAVLDSTGLDALIYPHQQRLVVPVGEEQVERNGVLSNSTGLPAVTFPAGFSPATATAPLGVPVGLELLGRAWSEARLLGLAAAYERAVDPRRAPLATPPLVP
jgi:amidase